MTADELRATLAAALDDARRAIAAADRAAREAVSPSGEVREPGPDDGRAEPPGSAAPGSAPHTGTGGDAEGYPRSSWLV